MRIFYGTHVFSFEAAIGTNEDSGFIDVVFGVPVLRAGGWVSASGARADFFAENNYSLGSVTSSQLSSTMPPEFIGWETSSYLIKHIRFTDIQTNNQTVLVLDRVTSEIGIAPISGPPAANNPSAIPEPATLLLMGSGLFGLAGFRKKFKKWPMENWGRLLFYNIFLSR
jgi:hypothetical protein